MTVVQGMNVTLSIAVLLLVSSHSSVQAQLALGLHEQVVHIWEAFFALHCLLLGSLIYRSGFVPKVLGPLMVMAALGYLANSVGNLLHPESKATLASIVAVTAIFGELPFFLWLLIKGIDDSPSLKRGAFPSWEEKLALEDVGGERARSL